MRVSANTTAAMATLVLVATASFALARCAPEGVVPLLDAATNDACATASSGAECTGGWCRIPAGCDVLGTPSDEFGRGPTSEPLTQVTLTHPYWMMQFEVVHAQVAAQGFPIVPLLSTDCVDCADFSLHYWDALRFANAVSRANGWEECYELTNCTLQAPDAGYDTTVCTVHSKRESLYECRGVRLPTEVEWEHAARAGTRTGFYAGEVTNQVDNGCHPDPIAEQIGWYCVNGEGRVHRPGLKQPNGWGLYDMSGNLALREV